MNQCLPDCHQRVCFDRHMELAGPECLDPSDNSNRFWLALCEPATAGQGEYGQVVSAVPLDALYPAVIPGLLLNEKAYQGG
jgi:hypothetical protein